MARALKTTYIGAVRLLKKVADKAGLLSALESRRQSRIALWVRSLFSIYDLDDLVHLDLAWWTFDSMDLVSDFLARRPGARVFEYGAGASTIWMARRGAVVTSVEHDPVWAMKMIERTETDRNINIRAVTPLKSASPVCGSAVKSWRDYDFEKYVHALDEEEGEFDLIVVDGRCRVACLERASTRLAKGGMLLFDNSRRKRYRGALESAGMDRAVTRGLVPGLPYFDETTLLFRPGE